MHSRKMIGTIIRYTLIILVLLLFSFPIYWLVMMSFKSNVEIFEIPPKFLVAPNLGGYFRVFNEANFTKYFTSSLIVAAGTIGMTFSCGIFAAYSFSRFNFRGKKLLKLIILSFRMMPAVILLIPLFIIFKRMRLLDTHPGMILTYTAFLLPFTIWMLAGYLDDIPKEIDESAFIDGCGYTKIIMLMIIPMAAPGMAAIAILVFGWSWNEFLLASLLTSSRSRTLPLIIQYFLGEHSPRWNDVSAVCTIMVVPIVIGILFFQKYMVRGLTLGAVKG
jgi:multiple sugar transport system permease protein